MILRKLFTAIFLASFLPVAISARSWDEIEREMRNRLEELSREYFVADSVGDAESPPTISVATQPSYPYIIVVGFTGGWEKKDSKSSGIAAMQKSLEAHVEGQNGAVLPMTFNNFRWRRAATQVLEVVGAARQKKDSWPGMTQPLIVVCGHSRVAGPIAKFARRLKNEGVEISLAIYIDAFSWRNPRVPDNVRYVANFYQRAGIFKGLPLRGKGKLILEDAQATVNLGSYEIKPQTVSWGWSWNILQPLLYRHHHRIAHDRRLEKYLLEIVNLKLEFLHRALATEEFAD